MDKDKFGAKDRVEELSPKEIRTIDSVMSDPQLFIDTYNVRRCPPPLGGGLLKKILIE